MSRSASASTLPKIARSTRGRDQLLWAVVRQNGGPQPWVRVFDRFLTRSGRVLVRCHGWCPCRRKGRWRSEGRPSCIQSLTSTWRPLASTTVSVRPRAGPAPCGGGAALSGSLGSHLSRGVVARRVVVPHRGLRDDSQPTLSRRSRIRRWRGETGCTNKDQGVGSLPFLPPPPWGYETEGCRRPAPLCRSMSAGALDVLVNNQEWLQAGQRTSAAARSLPLWRTGRLPSCAPIPRRRGRHAHTTHFCRAR